MVGKRWKQVMFFYSLQTLKPGSVSKLQYYSHHFFAYSPNHLFYLKKVAMTRIQWMMGPQSGTKEKTATKQSIKGKTKTWGFFFTPCPKKLPKLIQFYLIFIDLEKIFLVLDRKILLNIRMILNIHSFRKKKMYVLILLKWEMVTLRLFDRFCASRQFFEGLLCSK